MWRIIRDGIGAAVALICLSGPALAADRMRDCGYRLDAELAIEGGRVRLGDGPDRIELHDDGIDRNGQPLALTPAQRLTALTYRAELAALAPAVADLAWRGTALGVESLALVGAALGDDAASLDRLVARAESLALHVRREYDGRRLAAGHTLGDRALDGEIAQLATTAGVSLAGGIASLIAAAVFDPETARARGEFLQHLVERRIKPRADALAADAERLCARLHRIDALEAQLNVVDVVRSPQV